MKHFHICLLLLWSLAATLSAQTDAPPAYVAELEALDKAAELSLDIAIANYLKHLSVIREGFIKAGDLDTLVLIAEEEKRIQGERDLQLAQIAAQPLELRKLQLQFETALSRFRTRHKADRLKLLEAERARLRQHVMTLTQARKIDEAQEAQATAQTFDLQLEAFKESGIWAALGAPGEPANPIEAVALDELPPDFNAYWYKDKVVSANRMEITPDFTRLLTVSHGAGARLWDVRTGEMIRGLQGKSDVYWTAGMSASGTLGVGGGRSSARVWNLETGKQVHFLEGHRSELWGSIFMDQDRFLVTASFDRSISVWDLESGARVKSIRTGGERVRCLAGVDKEHAIGGFMTADAAPARIVVFNIHSGEHMKQLKGHDKLITDLAVNAAGSHVLSVSGDMTCCLWDIHEEENIWRSEKAGGWLESVCFSPDERFVFTCTGGARSQVHVLDVRTGRRLWSGPPQRAGHLAVVPLKLKQGIGLATCLKDGWVRFHKLPDNVLEQLGK